MDATTANFLIATFGATFGAVITAIAHYFTTAQMFREQRFENAAIKFREVLYGELSGIYPVTQDWEPKNIAKLPMTIPKIITAATEFKIVVKDKKCFEVAIEIFQSFCKGIDYHSASARIMLRGRHKPPIQRDKEDFQEVVEHFLSFTEKESLADSLRRQLKRLPKQMRYLIKNTS